MRTGARRTVAVGAGIALLTGAGVAFASWAATGTGSGTDTASGSTPFVVQQSGTATGLYPTGQSPVPFSVKNSNPYPVTLASAKANNFTADSAHPGCNVSSLSGVDLTLTDSLAAGATSSTKQMIVKMDNSAIDACQGATFTFDIKVTGASG